ncbi:Fur family transcriptional regulator [Inmirania thermothiophila]|uniref:Fur family zinc uptake transcriptional regulator n=1 Tax=Inmirania thermothiophila TaxID=1750597 RepID=A0A3N1XZE9_9GAMM|nr:Fur family transcriptional regulator [Inmirania thermothiophila]ROR31986.1 Fur family zinc uptake transcriptional regulator [Inmirania thermothiophila]
MGNGCTDHGRCIEEAVTRAEAACRRSGARLTPLRRRVLELVWRGHRPVGAYEILDGLRAEGRRAAPPTVYRALEFLQGLGLVHRIASRNAWLGCPRGGPHAGGFLVCAACGRTEEIEDRALAAAAAASAARHGFSAPPRAVEVVALCDGCAGTHGG